MHAHQLCQGVGVVLQRAVERLIGQVLRHQPGQRKRHRPQQQQRGEHPVEDLTEQGTLLTAKQGQGSPCGLKCCQRPCIKRWLL
ncbi:hypothetical protein D3C71_1898110 [compost metagenome]